MLKYPIVNSTVVLNSFLLGFTQKQEQLIQITTNCIHILNNYTLDVVQAFIMEETIQLATPLIQDCKSYIIVQFKNKLSKLSFDHALHYQTIEENPNYQECCSSKDNQAACFVGTQSVLQLGSFSQNVDTFLYAFPRKVILGKFGLAVLFSDSLHQVWIQCTKGDKLSTPQQVQEDIWDLVEYSDQIIAFGTSMSILYDPWQGKSQTFVLQNSNVVSAISFGNLIFISDTCGHLIKVSYDGAKMISEIIFVVSQANSMTFIQENCIFLGSKSGDSVIVNFHEKTILARQPTFSPIHDITIKDSQIICSTGMERTGGIKWLTKILKSSSLREVDLLQNIDNVCVLFQTKSKVLFQVNFKHQDTEGNNLYFYENNQLKQLQPINNDMSEYCRYFGIIINEEIYIVIVDDFIIKFFNLSCEIVKSYTVTDFAENRRILSCTCSPQYTKLIVTLTDNFISVIGSFDIPTIQHIQIDEIQQQLLSAAINEDNLIALIYNQIPYSILYKDHQTIIQSLTDKDFSVDTIDMNMFSLLDGNIPPNCTRPALLASLVSGKLAACPFSQDACQLQVGVIFLQFIHNQLIVGHKNGEVGVYQVQDYYCIDYNFYQLNGLKGIQITDNDIYAIDMTNQQFLLKNDVITQVFDGIIFSHQENNITLAFNQQNLLFMTDIFKSYCLQNIQTNTLSKSVCQLQDYLVFGSVKTTEVSTSVVQQAQQSIIQQSGYLKQIKSLDIQQVESPPSKKLVSRISLYANKQEISFLEFTNHHITTLISARLGRFDQDFICAGFVVPTESKDSGLIVIFQLVKEILVEKARFATNQGVYQLSCDKQRLYATCEQNIIAFEYMELQSAFLPQQIHGIPQQLFETGWISTCVFATSISTCDNLVVFSDIAKGIFVSNISDTKVRTEFKNIKRVKGKGVVCTDGSEIILAAPDGKLTIFNNKLEIEFTGDIGGQILCIKCLQKGVYIYGTIGGELGILHRIYDDNRIITAKEIENLDDNLKWKTALQVCQVI
ncbi:hypothetical protein SS50377_25454 [Spironucleus salmonicida]|uniref:Uncharacterized protein n=1 Tax=Spironucleus salmonicida TaxID=348837 RepID=V6LKB4_9EUKA|nr:hypothetical protein SS50377_25454 [Spironucleus salmonicida]|eukprot:EST45002.1 Hypothetical protein SS50377_15021 [Spironucleus salmonicida]